MMIKPLVVMTACCLMSVVAQGDDTQLTRISYRDTNLTVDLGVGLWAWPLPMDYDDDGDLDLVVVCPDKPYNGAYFFENPQGKVKHPVFKPGVRISKAERNAQLSVVDGETRVLTPNRRWPSFKQGGFAKGLSLGVKHKIPVGKIRANQWREIDFDGDGNLDLLVGVGEWADYGWDNAFNSQGKWIRGPLHGYLYLMRNLGTNDAANYAKPMRLQADGRDIDVFGMPSPNYADFDGDGDCDLVCGEFLDRFTYFQNVGTRNEPRFAGGVKLRSENGKPLAMDLQMIVPNAIDWDGDGDPDLVVGDEDGRVALVENTGASAEGRPVFRAPHYFRQQAADVKFGALATPYGVDWDGDGDQDIITGNTAGYIGFIENLDGKDPPRLAAPKLLTVAGQPIRIQAGTNGSIQGPAEAKWGYTTLTVADWDHDGLHDLVVNSIWGKVIWFRNQGSRQAPELTAAQPIEVQWKGKPTKPAWNWWDPAGNELSTQWRTTPVVVDWNEDGLNDLVMLDHEGYLGFYRRERQTSGLVLLPPVRVFHDEKGEPLKLSRGDAGRSGRRKICIVDWDGDGRRDILINSQNADWLRNVSTDGGVSRFENRGLVDPRILAGHTTSPTTVDWDGNGVPDLLLGAEDGFFYYKRRQKIADR